jgi:hypothetical protein
MGWCTGMGLREWLGTLQKGSSRVAVASFDTPLPSRECSVRPGYRIGEFP